MADKPSAAAIALGANLGDPVAAFAFALDRLRRAPATRLLAMSSIYKTAPWGKHDQPDFLNMAALIKTAMSPRDLLDACLAIETDFGRIRAERWGPRALDLDIIDFDGMTLQDGDLILPHPRAADRAFVLAPLAEIAPDLRLGRRSAAQILAGLDGSGVTRDVSASARLATELARLD